MIAKLSERLVKKIDQYSQGRSKIYIVPTPAGVKFVMVNFTLFLISLSYANNMALLISFLMVAYLIISMLDTHRFVQDTIIEDATISDFFLNQTPHLFIKSKEPIDPKALEFLEIELLSEDGNIKSIKGGMGQDLSYQFELSVLHRGYFKTNRLKLYTRGINQFFYVWRYFELPQEFFAYPPKRFTHYGRQTDSNQQTSMITESEFQFHIPYVHGLSSKRIDWKVFAKSDMLYWKKHTDFESQSIEINYHTLPGETEEKLEYISFLVDKFFRLGQPWKLVLPTKVFSHSKGIQHYKKCLEAVSVF